jgi:fructokinase
MSPATPKRPDRARCALLGEALVDLLPQGMVIGGAPFNVARNLAGLGEPPVMITRLGRDELGAGIIKEFERFAMPTWGVQDDDTLPTGTVRVVMERGTHRFEIGAHQAWDAIDAVAARAAVAKADCSLVYFGSLAQREAISRDAIRTSLATTGALRFLDLNLRDGPDNETLTRESIALAHVLKLNEDELARTLGWLVDADAGRAPWGSDAHRTAMAALCRRFTLKRVIVTRGEQGYAAFDSQGQCIAAGPAPRVAVIDTVGAGDAFTAVCMIGLVHDWPTATTLERASEFAASVCTLAGAVSPDLDFYASWRARWQLDAAAA